VVTSRISIKAKLTGGRMTNVYVKRHERWQCVSSHASGKAGRDSAVLELRAKTQFELERPDEMVLIRKRAERAVRVGTRFDCLVEKVFVKAGQTVKKGDPLVDLFSTELAAAKNDFQTTKAQWVYDQTMLLFRQKQFANKDVSEQILVDARNDAKKSGLGFSTARQRLLDLGVDDEAIGRLAKGEDGNQARLTDRATVDGTVVEVRAKLGKIYNQSAILIVIDPANPAEPDAKQNNRPEKVSP
jgi:pyruvate/2-oxoglutarate dehydrogenase complex dihydrolipoamide acyltransferase (E2) component